MNNYSVKGKGNFFDEEEIDDDEFLRHPKSGTTGYALPQQNHNYSNSFNQPRNTEQQNVEHQRQELAERRREIEERTLASSERGLGLLFESEKVGIATADELTRQKEQLLRTENRLDDINSTLRNSEKHIQGIKSVFGSIRNYFSGRGSAPPAPGGASSSLTPSQSAPQFNSNLDQLHQNPDYQDHHPGLQNRPGLVPKMPVDVDAALDKNLDDMASGLARLKGLAQGLNSELNEHDDLIDRVNVKTEDVKFKIDRQNKDMGKILGKK